MNLRKMVIAPLCAFALLLLPSVGSAQKGRYLKDNKVSAKGIQPDNEAPIVGAHVYVFSIGMSRPNSAPTSLIADNGAQTVTMDPAGNTT